MPLIAYDVCQFNFSCIRCEASPKKRRQIARLVSDTLNEPEQKKKKPEAFKVKGKVRIPRSKSHVSLTNVMLAKIITRQLNQLDEESQKAFKYTMKNLTGIMSASLCSGAGTDSMVQRVLLAMFRPDLEHSTAYSVECKAVKQKWLTTVVHAGCLIIAHSRTLQRCTRRMGKHIAWPTIAAAKYGANM